MKVDKSNIEIDLHAHACVLGNCALIVCDYGNPVNVVGSNPEVEAQELQTVLAAIKYTHLINS